MKINRPWLVQIELVCGCNLSCDFCANVSLPGKGKDVKYMNKQTFINIISDLRKFGDKLRVAFAMRGEPTLHRGLIKYTQLLKNYIPKCQISLITNGRELSPLLLERFFLSGGNIVSIDCYGNTYDRFKELFGGSHFMWKTYDYRDFNIWQYHKHDIKVLSLIPDIRKDHANTRSFTNQCDCISNVTYDKYSIQRPVDGGLEKKCTNPFREMAIRFNGDMMVCCKDWVSNEMVIANVNKSSIYGAWFTNKKLNVIRKLLLNRCRSFHPCDKCTYFGGYRQGFLPKTKTLTSNGKKILSDLLK